MVERFLFVVGDRNTGKSTQFRSLFLDPRLGFSGQVPGTKNVPDSYSLSIDRNLYLRLTSPHEVGETLNEFLSKIHYKTQSGRWCVAAPLQLDAFKNMPDLVTTVRGVIAKFQPDRVRVCILSPDRHGTLLDPAVLLRLFDDLWALGPVECQCIDARYRTNNGTLLAGYLDYA